MDRNRQPDSSETDLLMRCKRAEEALDLLQSRFRAVVASSSNLIYRMSADWTEMRHMQGRNFLANTTEPNPNWFEEYIPPGEQLRVMAAINEAIRTKSTFELEHQVIQADGSIGWTLSRAVPVFDSKGEIVEWFGVANDITKRKNAEESLRNSEKKALELVDQLREVDQNKNAFINMLSHELRNPITAIMMSLDLMDEYAADGEQTAAAKEIAKRQCKQLSLVAEDLLDIARITRNKVNLKKEEVELNGVIRQAVMDHQLQFTEKEVDLEVKLTSPLYIEADPYRLLQVVGNLLHNAVKFTNEHDRVIVSVSQNEVSNEAVIMVQDTGYGILPEYLDKLFEPFTQSDKSLDRSKGGLGLGLAVVKGIVELHGGSVEAFSEGLDQGARFTIRLPLMHQQKQDSEVQPENDNQQSHLLSILVIEDNPDLNVVLQKLIGILGYETIAAYDGTKGIELARAYKPDVVLCDIGLPGISGYEVAKALYKDPELKNTQLIALSGYAQPKDIEQSMEAGFDRHIGKPVDLATLRDILQETLNEQKPE
jgi:signal transduction histidine kinase/ActR/RegA family two-component response regulator